MNVSVRTLMLWSALALGLAFLSTPSSAAQRMALVIGNAAYEEIGPLRNPARDAAAISERLSGFGFELIGRSGKPVDGPVLNVGRREFRRTVRAFARTVREAGDVEVAFVYYAGHGMQDGRRSYLLPVDVAGTDVELALSESIPLDDVLTSLDGHAELTVAVFDACREIGELESSIERATRSGSSSGSEFRGLARPRSAGRSRLVAYAGAAGQLVADGQGDHSPYTEILLESLEQAAGRPIEDVFQGVAYHFGRRHAGQDPELLTQGVEPNRFFLARAEEPKVEDETSESGALESLLWTSAQAGGTAEEYGIYLERFPSGVFAELARLRVGRLVERADLEAEEPTATPSTGRLTVRVKPADARVRIMNIVPRYQAGMKLALGERYDVLVTREGYSPYRDGVVLENVDQLVDVELSQSGGGKSEPVVAEVLDDSASFRAAHPGPYNSYALSSYRRCEGGVASACTSLGHVFYVGAGIGQSDAHAVTLYERGCQSGDKRGCTNLDNMYADGRGGSKSEPVMADVLDDAAPFQAAHPGPYNSSALSSYRRCEGGVASACTSLGSVFYAGAGIEQSDAHAVTLYERACQSGDIRGCTNLGNMYADGRGVLKDESKAVVLYESGCRGGDVRGCLLAGVNYENGTGVDSDQTLAKRYYQRACDGGNEKACGLP